MRRDGLLPCLFLAVVMAAGCASNRLETTELTARGPAAEELLSGRSYAVNGRAPTFDEKRQWEGQVEERVFRYLREHPELEQTARYTEFRFWWQVTAGSTPGEVRVLLEEPQEKTIDPARMGALAQRHWADLEGKAREAWVYEPAWIIYFGDAGVVGMVHRVSSIAPAE
jgi:hypothetical protein